MRVDVLTEEELQELKIPGGWTGFMIEHPPLDPHLRGLAFLNSFLERMTDEERRSALAYLNERWK